MLDRPGEFSLGKMVFFGDQPGNLFISKVNSVSAAAGVETVVTEDPFPFPIDPSTCFAGFLYFVRLVDDQVELAFDVRDGEVAMKVDLEAITVKEAPDFPSDELLIEDGGTISTVVQTGALVSQLDPPDGFLVYDDFAQEDDADPFTEKLDAFSGWGGSGGMEAIESSLGIFCLETWATVPDQDPLTASLQCEGLTSNFVEIQPEP